MSANARVLVTGAKGCIGAWTARYLLDRGHDVVALDLAGSHTMHRFDMILEGDLARVTLLEGDALDADVLVNGRIQAPQPAA